MLQMRFLPMHATRRRYALRLSFFSGGRLAICIGLRNPPAGSLGRSRKEVLHMKLYFAPGACSLSPHIVLREAGMNFDLEQVNNQEKKTKSGIDYWTINAKGQ